jgi:uncharacterized protein (TIGR02145 family)
MKKIFVVLSMVAFLVACDDSASASAENKDSTTLSSAEGQVSSSSTKKLTDSSDSSCEECNDDAISSSGNANSNGSSDSKGNSFFAGKAKSSSSERDVPKSYAEAKVMPSGTYDCSKYSCFSTEYLNQEFLEADKYGEILDERDGKVYRTVKIGNQVWMAENLNYDLGPIRSSYQTDWSGCYYSNKVEHCDDTGRLYSWEAAINPAKLNADKLIDCGYGLSCALPDTVYGICPSGWHLPDTTEWIALFTAVGGQSAAGTVLKSWRFRCPLPRRMNCEDGTDDFGFSAQPGGYRYDFANYYGGSSAAFFWSSSESGAYSAFSMRLINTDKDAYWGADNKNHGFSIRCVKN